MSRSSLLRVFALCVSMLGTQANAVLEWNPVILDAIRLDNSGPTVSTRNLALIHTAIYDAVNSIEGTHQPYSVFLPPTQPASAEAAAHAATHELMLILYPGVAARTEQKFQNFMAGRTSDPPTLAGVNLGRTVARAILDSRMGDGSSTDVPYIPSDLPGQWRRTPPFFRPPVTPHWRYVRLFALPDPAPFLPPPPPALESEAYAEAFQEVKALGGKGSTVRTAEQSEIAVFWSDFSYTSMPPGHWHEITASIALPRQLPLPETARLFALLSLAQADAAIISWEAKFRHNLWRPVTAIQRAAEDGNPLTEADPGWDHFLAAPPFPAYTSGHSTFSKASAQVLTRFYGTDAVAFTATSDSLPGVQRHFTSLAACAEEIGMSRIYGGIHYQFDNTAGKTSGELIGDYVSANWLLANDLLPRIHIERFADGKPLLRMHGQIAQRFITQCSEDLRIWTNLSTNTAVSGGVPISDPQAAGLKFYRVLAAP